jgi:hypothetical protein
MKKLRCLVLTVLVLAVLGAVVTYAQSAEVFYCKVGYSGSEDGTKDKPYDTCDEAQWVAVGSDLGGYVCAWDVAKGRYQDPTKSECVWYPGCRPGAGGAPFAQQLLWIGLAVIAVLLVGTGLFLRLRLGKRPTARP